MANIYICMYFFTALQEMGHFLTELKGNNPIKKCEIKKI